MRFSTFVRGLVAGMLGGLAGTVLMYFFGVGIFTLLGWPANTSFSIIGDAAAAFFARLGIDLAGGVPLGMRVYTLIGLILGGGFGAAVVRLERLRLYSLTKKVGLSILFVELMSLPLLSAGVLALEMNISSAVQWFSISFVMHLAFGLALGVVTSFGTGKIVQPSPV